MPNQENGNIRHITVRLDMTMVRKLQLASDCMKCSMSDAIRIAIRNFLSHINVNTPIEKKIIKRMVDDNWKKIRARENRKANKK